MRFRFMVLVVACLTLTSFPISAVSGQQGATNSTQADASPSQRLEVMRSRLDALRRSLNNAIASLNSEDKGQSSGEDSSTTADNPRTRLRGLEREVSTISAEVNDLRGKQERAERYDVTSLDKLETSINDLNERAQTALRATAGERRNASSDASTSSRSKKKKGGFFSRILGRGGDGKYDELTGTVAPGRDRQLFEDATKEARESDYETARYLYNVIITTYPESNYLPAAKLAIADTFYLEGSTSGLIQASAAYRDWLTFFPTDPLADDVMLKLAEVEMRQMGLADRDTSHARKAEQQLKVLVQQFPNTSLRSEVDTRMREVQENLALHNLQVANFYNDRYQRGVASNVRGAQSRLREVVEKYPNFSYMDEALFRLGVTYVQEEEPDEAAKYFQQLLRNHPNSEFADKAREQLDAIGAPKPDPDPKKASEPPPVRPSLTERMLQQVVGSTSVTVNKNGVLISKDNKSGDLIDRAIASGGQLQNDTTPTAPVYRRPPARPPVQATPATTSAQPTTSAPGTTDGTSSGREGSISVQPTRPGPPAGSNTAPQAAPGSATPPATPPAVPPATPPATQTPTSPPATTTPSGGLRP